MRRPFHPAYPERPVLAARRTFADICHVLSRDCAICLQCGVSLSGLVSARPVRTRVAQEATLAAHSVSLNTRDIRVPVCTRHSLKRVAGSCAGAGRRGPLRLPASLCVARPGVLALPSESARGVCDPPARPGPPRRLAVSPANTTEARRPGRAAPRGRAPGQAPDRQWKAPARACWLSAELRPGPAGAGTDSEQAPAGRPRPVARAFNLKLRRLSFFFRRLRR